MIDQLLEKYLTGYKLNMFTVDVFVNPTGSEIKEILKAEEGRDSCRFIADAKEKKVYVWNAGLAIHKRTWGQLYSSDMVTDREFYNKSRYLSGEADGRGEIDLEYAFEYATLDIIDDWKQMDWAWLNKILKGNIDKVMEYEYSRRG